MIYDYTATRERAGPEEFLQNYRGYLAGRCVCGMYDSFFLKPERGMVEVGCWAHARRGTCIKAGQRIPRACGHLLLMIAELYLEWKALARQRGLGAARILRLMREQGARLRYWKTARISAGGPGATAAEMCR